MKASFTTPIWVRTVLLLGVLFTAIGAKAQISYTPLTFGCPSDIALNGVTITDPTGVVTTGTFMPRIYFRKNSDPWVSAVGTMTGGSSVTSTWNFTMSATAMGGLAVSDVVSYYVIAQNTGGSVFSNPPAGMTATDVNTVITPPTSPNTLTLDLPSLTGLVTIKNTCFNTSSPQTATYAYSGTTQGANQYMLSWSPSGPTDVISFTSLPAGSITATVPTGTAVGNYTGTLTVRNSSNGCTNSYTLTLNVDSLPSPIAGTPYVCLGATGTLSSSPAGGTWASATSAVVSIDAAGVITGNTVGTTTVTYTAATGCKRTQSIAVNGPPNLITGTLTVCEGSNTTLADASVAGTWSSSDPSIASIGLTSGIAAGMTAGTATITYTITTGCYRTAVITVNPTPVAIAGSTIVCPGTTSSLIDATSGGTWSSSVTGVATIGVSTGVLTGVAAGTSIISYKHSNGCAATAIATVQTAPPAISGTATVCLGGTSSLSNAAGAGTWTSSNTLIASVDPTGLVTGVGTGTATITFTVASSCYRTLTFTVNPLPGAITGATAFCEGTSSVLASTPTGGTWSSGSAIAPVGPTSGAVTGMSAGFATITYTLSTGCRRTADITINPSPAAITGGTTVCAGSTITLSSATSGGTWTGGTSGIATVGSATGVVTGVGAGTVKVTYTVSTGCKSTLTVTVNALPFAIGGSLVQCAGATTGLTSGTAGGTWTSSNPSVATITSSTALVTAVAAGTSTISYTVGTGCARTAIFTVNPLPAAITGATTICAGNTTSLTNDSLGGVWTSSMGSVASVGFTTGVVTGATAGTATITYTIPNTCKRTVVVSVNALPASITGTFNICIGYTATLNNLSTGGSWVSSSPAIASIDGATGVVTALTAGTSVISYIMPTGCFRTQLITVNSSPAPITGTYTVCAGSITTLASATSGGTWSSSNTYAFAYPSGAIGGVAAGSATITYTLPTGCFTTTGVTINPIPNAISGSNSLCTGTVTTLATTSTGGTWSSSNTAVAGITPLGEVSGAAAGTAIISYSFADGCRRTTTVTVQPIPTAITGTLSVCTGLTTTLHNTVIPGTWSSSNTAVAVIGSGTGIVNAASPGTTTITYTSGAGCTRTAEVTVSLSPSGISGTNVICTGQTTSLINTVAGGTWTSGTTIASVDAVFGVVLGVTYGNAGITYTLPNGCRSTTIVTVNPLPSAITGLATVCKESITTLSSATGGGTWSSSNTSVASITVIPGYVSGVSVGTAQITYKLSTGCLRTQIVTVNPIPVPISAPFEVCASATINMTDTTPGGLWSSSNLAVALVGSISGVVTGMSGGTSVITYRLSTGCKQIKTITVNPQPATITGSPFVCVGSFTYLANAISGGSWSSSNPAVATIDPTGYVTGITPGSVTITYALVTTGCYKTITVIVHPLPNAITGTTAVCPALTTTLSDSTIGGTWTSAVPSVATVGYSNGIVTGVAAGTTYITYQLPTGCKAVTLVTVHPLPAPIAGGSEMCAGNSTTLSTISTGGSWSSSSTTIATVGSATGIVTGVSAGTAYITYTQPSGCIRTKIATIDPLPATISGSLSTCISATTELSDVTTGGAWSSSTPTVATIGPVDGVVTGLSAGTTQITYQLPTGCRTSTVVTVHPAPAPITGTGSMCAGSSITLGEATTGGTWSSAYPSIAVVNTTTGEVTGVATGVAIITYTTAEDCRVTAHVTVTLSPGPITGSLAACLGHATDLNDYVAGGVWTSSDTGVATINSATGLVTSVTVGTTNITYTIAGCSTSKMVTVNLSPGPITGASAVCMGSSMSLYNSVAGGVWNSSNGAIATISPTGLVYGVFTGTAVISYTIGGACHAFDTIVVAETPPFAELYTHPADSLMCINTLYQNFGTYPAQPAGVIYTWSVENAQIFQQSPDKQYTLISFKHPGRAVIKLSSSLSATGCQLADSFVVHVGTDTSITDEVAYYDGKFVCSDNTADAYQWGYDNNTNFDSTILPYGTHQDYNLPSPDFFNNAYWVITTHGDCRQKSYYNTPTAIRNIYNGTADIRLFPNPAESKVSIELNDVNYRDNAEVKLTDITGKEISFVMLKNGKASFDLDGIPAGTYVVAVYKGDIKVGSKILIKN